MSPYGVITNYPDVYPNRISEFVPSGQNADIVGKPVYDRTNGIKVSYSCYSTRSYSVRDCAVKVPNSNGTFTYFGGVFAQNYYQCPIDDYVPYIILLFGGIGFIIIRRRTLFLT